MLFTGNCYNFFCVINFDKNSIMKKLLLLLFIVFLFACNKKTVFEKFEKFDTNEWAMNKVVQFDVPIDDTSSLYNIAIPVRHIENYPFDGLLVNVTYYSPNGEERTKNYKLKFRDAAGNFIGDGSGDIWDEYSVIMKKMQFNAKGTYKFEITNAMDKTPTPCIMEVGLSIEKGKKLEPVLLFLEFFIQINI